MQLKNTVVGKSSNNFESSEFKIQTPEHIYKNPILCIAILLVNFEA